MRIFRHRHLHLIPLAAIVVGCSGGQDTPFVYEPWSMPVPEGTRTIGISPIEPDERRDEPIELEVDLVFGDSGDDFNYLFGSRTIRVAPGEDGTIFVVDTSNQRVQVFDREGSYVRTLGRSGQGPGEFSFPMAVAVAGDHLFISDSNSSRLSKWTLDGLLVWDRPVNLFPGYMVSPAQGLLDGTFLIRYRPARATHEVIRHLDAEGEEISEFAERPVPERVFYSPFSDGAATLAFYAGKALPMWTATPSGDVYTGTLEKYQVFAFTAAGEMRWALQMPVAGQPVDRAEKEWGASLMRGQRFPDTRVSDIDWPERRYDLGDMKVDGRGRLYVFPYVSRGSRPERIPVDVYDRDGRSIYHGWLTGEIADLLWQGTWKFGPMLDIAWQTARGEYIYGAILDPETDAARVIRYRLVVPFRDRQR